eukprot:c12569_g1_i1 orf=53-994(+)
MDTVVPLKQKKRKRQRAHPISAPDATALVASHLAEAKQAPKSKKERRKKRRLALDGDPAAPHGTHQPTTLVPHVGVDRTNSNWKQLQATLNKGQAFRKTQNVNPKAPAEGADVPEPGKSRQAKLAEDVTQRLRESLSPKNENCSLTKILSMDCEMVGAGLDGKRSILARVSLVNMWGNVVYDKHVRPMEQVTDYRTNISGVRPSNLRKGEDFAVVQKEVAELLKGRVLVGHSLRNDLKIMYLSHPKKDIRDTAAYPPLRGTNGRPRALRHMAEEILGAKIQVGEHCSVQDARAAMYIYQHLRPGWEDSMRKRR